MRIRILISLVIFFIGACIPFSIHADPVIFPTMDIVIDVGHGGVDGGTSHGQLLEKNINLSMALTLQKQLEAYGFSVAVNRSGDFAPSEDNHWLKVRSRHKRDLAQRKLLMTELRPKAVVSLHVNWAANPTRHGPVVIYEFKQQSYILANLIQNSLNELYGTLFPPYYTKSYYLLNYSQSPTVIVEMGFISSPLDRKMLCEPDNQTKLAKAISDAIWEHMLLFDMPVPYNEQANQE